LSYKTTRIYEVKLLDRLIDYNTMIDNSITALSEFANALKVDGFIGCTLTLRYPDLGLIDRRKGGWNRRVKRASEKIHGRFTDVDWAITRLEGELFNTLDFADDIPPHTSTARTRSAQNRLSEL
jgi:hypothetical protein